MAGLPSCTWDQFPCYFPENNFTLSCVNGSDYNCSMFDDCGCPYMKGDADIAGIGVIVAFGVSTALTLFLTIIYLILKREYQPTSLNRFDRVVRRIICKPVRSWITPAIADKWAKRLYAVILTLSDTQIVSGIAMLCSAIELMRKGNIIVYHFNLVSSLAWFSSNTHLLSLLVVQAHLGSYVAQRAQIQQTGVKPPFDNKDILRYARAVLMVVLAVLLLYVNWISGVEDLYDYLNCPMTCMLGREKGGAPLNWTIVNMFLILWSYPVRILRCIPSLARRWLSLRDDITAAHQSVLQSSQKAPLFIKYGYTALAFLTYWTWNLLASELESILELTAWLVYGIVTYRADRDLGKTATFWDVGSGNELAMTKEQWEVQNAFSFGQMLPLFLLMLPVMTFIEALGD